MAIKVLMIGWEYPPFNSGGLGVACKAILECLADAGIEVILILPKTDPESLSEYRVTKGGRRYLVFYVSSPLRPYVSGGDDVFSYAKKIVHVVGNESFDIVHIHDWLTVLPGLEIKRRFKKPLVMQVHSTEYDRTAGGEPNSMARSIEEKGLMEADRVIAVSHYTKKIIEEQYGTPAAKIAVVHNGIEFPGYTEAVKEELLGNVPVILYLGRLTAQKGVEYFIQMAKQVLEVRPETIFLISGDGDMYQKLIDETAFQELTGSVLFTGFMRDVSKERLYRRANIFVMPSVSEPFGLVALEAASYGMPVIISKTSGVGEILPAAIKIDFWDRDLMARHILDLIEDKERRRKLGQETKEQARMVTWEIAAEKIIKIYKNMLGYD